MGNARDIQFYLYEFMDVEGMLTNRGVSQDIYIPCLRGQNINVVFVSRLTHREIRGNGA